MVGFAVFRVGGSVTVRRSVDHPRVALRSQLTPQVTGIPLSPAQKRAMRGKRSPGFKQTGATLGGFTPYAGALPPAGTYDPTLDANYAAAVRGFGDLQRNTERDNTRAGNDLTLGLGAIKQRQGYSLADNLRTRTRTNEDYGTATTALGKSYSDLGARQAESAQQAGAVGGGALADALLKRTANQGVQQATLDTSKNRTLADLLQSDTRINQAAKDQGGALTLNYGRGVEDRNQVQVPIAQRELTQFGIDTTAQKGFQAAQSGLYVAPTKAANEFRSPGGTPYRVLKTSKGNKYMLASGQIVAKRPA